MPEPDLSRYADWMDWLTGWAREDPDLLVVWVGGSAATGGFDAWSDLDVDVLVTSGAHEAAYERLLAGVRADLDPDHVWELPADVWPDGRQCFVSSQPRPGLLEEPTRIVDLHLSSISAAHRHVDVRRHGTPLVLHDPDGLLVLREDDEEEMRRAMAAALDQVRQRRGIGEWLVNRALARGHLAEAVDLYLRFGLAPLVRLLRGRHCPWRHDFGLRYLDVDLPPDVAGRVVALVPGRDDLAALSARCFAWQDELLAAPAAR